MKRTILRLCVLLCVSALLGCAINREMSFENKTVTTDYSAAKSLVVTFQENRKEVIVGEQKPSYCGRIKSPGQIAYNMQTKNGRPLMEEFCSSLTGSLTKLGIKAQSMAVPVNAEKSVFMEQFAKKDGERLLHFTVTQWDANATPRVIDVQYGVTWEFAVSVYDKSGNQLASKAVANRVTKDEGHLAVNKEYLQKMADQVFVEQIKNLLNDPAVKASLMN
jgi:hypothetical protein